MDPHNQELNPSSKVNWVYVFLYYTIAVLIAAPFNSGVFSSAYSNLTGNYLISEWSYLPACLGPFLAALFLFLIQKKHKRKITFWGNDIFKNSFIALTPLLVFTIIGLENTQQQNNHFYGLVFAGINLIYGIGEEIGWRGYLQDALEPLNKNFRFLLIGIMWWAWHFRFQNSFDWTVFLAVCVGGSFLIGKFADDTQSFFCAAGLHSLIIITTNSGAMTNSKLFAGVLVILIWLGIGKFWKKQSTATE
jgi:uncharacterized protein